MTDSSSRRIIKSETPIIAATMGSPFGISLIGIWILELDIGNELLTAMCDSFKPLPPSTESIMDPTGKGSANCSCSNLLLFCLWCRTTCDVWTLISSYNKIINFPNTHIAESDEINLYRGARSPFINTRSHEPESLLWVFWFFDSGLADHRVDC